jgi:3-hydroxyacyl-CoA dehydrogenase
MEMNLHNNGAAVRTKVINHVLLIEINNPPVNAGSLAVRSGLRDAIAQLARDPGLSAGVIIGAGSTFVAGADLREFGLPLQEPQLPSVITAIEACSKPVVAALHGAALGGGLELALACDARIALAGTALGLPEVTLGIIPGAGGTQRLARLVGVARAIELICSGERISADKALQLKLVDAVVADDLQGAAIAHARSSGARKSRIRDLSVPLMDAALIEPAEKAALRAGKQRPAVLAAIKAIKNSLNLPIDEALAHERAAFEQLRLANDAFALRHQFFAEREATRLPADLQATPRAVQTIAIIGAGTMGTGIAICALDARLDVILLEQDAAALERGRQRVVNHYQSRVTAGKLKAGIAASNEGRLHPTTDWTLLGRADLVIEAVFEDLAVKLEVFKKIDAHARAGAVLATGQCHEVTRSRARQTQQRRRAGHRHGDRQDTAQVAGADRQRLWFHRQPHLQRLPQAVRIHARRRRLAGGRRRRAAGLRLCHGPLHCGRSVWFGHRLAHAQGAGCHA